VPPRYSAIKQEKSAGNISSLQVLTGQLNGIMLKEHNEFYWKGVFHGGTENGIHKKI
jgi:hypothetical protein